MKHRSKQTHATHPSFLTVVMKLSFPLWRQIKGKTTQEDNESFIRTLKAIGMSEEKVPKILALIGSMRKVSNNRKENYKSDKIYVAGIAALNLILFQILASVGKPDIASYLSWATFAVSLPCAAGFLYISLLQDRNEDYSYSIVHEKLAFVSVMAGAICAITLAWHFWPVAGIILLTASLLILSICALSRLFLNDEFSKTFNAIINEIANNSQEKEN